MSKNEHYEKKQKKEQEMFIIFSENISSITNIKFTKLNSTFDVSFISADTKIISEIKVREDKYDKNFFIRNGAFIEYNKFESLWKKKIQIKHLGKYKSDVKIFYLHFSSDNFLLIYELNNIKEYKFKFVDLPINGEHPDILMPKLVTELFNPLEIIKIK